MTGLALPRFLPRGLDLLAHEPDGWSVRWVTEADLRDGLATIWWLHGADVQTEVKVPNCGRIDILVVTGDLTTVIEVKRKVTTPSEALAAFQQAHTYRAFREAERPLWHLRTEDERRQRIKACVVARDLQVDALVPASRAFDEVDWCSYSHALARAVTGRDEYDDRCTSRADIRGRLVAAQRLVDHLERADRDLIALDEAAALRELTSA